MNKTAGIYSTALHGNVDADASLFRAAVDFAWFHNHEFAIVATDTVIGSIGESDRQEAYAQLLALAREAKSKGIAELIFNNTDF